MNKSDVSDADLNKEEEEEQITGYVPPKNIPISEIWHKDAEDPSLTKYKEKLIGGAINVILGILATIIFTSLHFT